MDLSFKKCEALLREVHATKKILKSIKRVNVFQGADPEKFTNENNLSNEEIDEITEYILPNKIILRLG